LSGWSGSDGSFRVRVLLSAVRAGGRYRLFIALFKFKYNYLNMNLTVLNINLIIFYVNFFKKNKFNTSSTYKYRLRSNFF
jgi:hypothetical protein